MVQYFHEKDNRMRIQKQMCDRDPTGVVGCLAGKRDFDNQFQLDLRRRADQP